MKELFETAYYRMQDRLEGKVKIKMNFSASLNSFIKITDDDILLFGQTDSPSSACFPYPAAGAFAVRIPVGITAGLFGFPAAEITNKAVSLYDFQKIKPVKQMLEEIGLHTDTASRVKTFEKLISCSQKESLPGMIIRSCVNRGLIGIKKLESESGYSGRQLQRIFLDHTGFTPKLFLEILRFQRNADQISSGMDSNEYGYYDQSHRIKDFKRFSGCTPGDFKKSMSDFYNTGKTFYVNLMAEKT